jgi:hypothetical protein
LSSKNKRVQVQKINGNSAREWTIPPPRRILTKNGGRETREIIDKLAKACQQGTHLDDLLFSAEIPFATLNSMFISDLFP